MRVAWFTPVGDGAVADYSRGVLTALLRLCEARLFCVGPPDRFPAGIPATDLAAAPQVLSELPSFDAVFYNLGNDPEQYARIFEFARLHPGIVVLHDLTMHRFFLVYYVRYLRRPDLYIARMTEHYGMSGLRTARRILGHSFDADSARVADEDLQRYTFAEEALHSARGAIVHSRWHGAIVRKLWSGPVCETWLPAQRPSASSVPALTGPDELGENRTTLMTFGPVEPRTHIADVIDLLAEDPELGARVRFVVAGAADPADAYVAALEAKIAESGLTRTVRMLGHLRPHEVDRCARAADAFINLRHPDYEGCSMSLMYLLQFGKPVVTYDVGSLAEAPDEAVVKVGVGDGAGLRDKLCEIVKSPTLRRAVGDAGRRFAAGHGAREYARELLRFAAQDVRPAAAAPLEEAETRAVAERIATHIGETLSSLGVTPHSRGVETVIREADILLTPRRAEPV